MGSPRTGSPRRSAIVAVSLAALVFSPAFAAAGAEPGEPEEPESARRWLPSIAVISGATIQDWQGESRATFVPDLSTLPMDAPPEAVQNAMDQAFDQRTDGSDRDITAFMGGSLELMTPTLPLPLSPRLFVGGELTAYFGTLRGVATDGEVGDLRSAQANEAAAFPEQSTLGQGSEVRGEVDTLVYGAHAGIAFPVELLGHRLRIKPSFAWIRYDIEFEGRFAKAECRRFNSFNFLDRRGCSPSNDGFLREVTGQASDAETFDGIGPGLDVELDTGRVGPLGTSLFVAARVYRILGEREFEIDGPTQEFAFVDDVSSESAFGTPEETGALPGGTASSRFSFDIDPWVYRVGVGLRIHWVGWD